jgi:hypothetical protein
MIYPKWSMRVYHNIEKEDETECKLLCRQRDEIESLQLCYITDLPDFPPFDCIFELIKDFSLIFTRFSLNFSAVPGRIWRFLPMIDSRVDAFISRDADSLISERESAAVDEWLKSNKIYHVMHDHPAHFASIPGESCSLN